MRITGGVRTEPSLECYAATRPQEGRSTNEDAFLIANEGTPLVALCDGAGNAEQAARKVLRLLRRHYSQADQGSIDRFSTWARWVGLLDSALLGGAQSTMVAVAARGRRVVGVAVGDTRAYLIDREGDVQILTGADGAAGKARLGSGRAQGSPIHLELAPRDVLLLVSDGAWTPLSPELLRRAVVSAAMRHFSDVSQVVLDAASRYGRADDMTAVAMRTRC